MTVTPGTGREQLFSRRRRPAGERMLDIVFRQLTLALAAVVAIVLLAIFLTLIQGSHEAIASFGLRFLTTSAWDPVNESYGAFVAIYGTLVSSLLALLIAVPLGVGTALFITEDLIPMQLRELIGLMVELLAAIPSVVLGLWAIFVMEPAIRPVLQLLHAVLGWLPLFSTTPMGPGMAPAMLALGRAMGETMAVTMIIGNSLNFSFSLLAPGNTIASMLANQFGEADGIQVSALMYAALILMVLTFSVNVLAQWVVRRLSLKY